MQFRLAGAGAMEKLSHTSALIVVGPEMCPRCTSLSGGPPDSCKRVGPRDYGCE